MPLDLTTITLVKMFANIPTDTTAYDATLSSLITGTSDQIAKYLNRNFTYDLYNEQFIGEDSNDISLNNYPIQNIIYAGYGLSTVIDLTYSGSNYPSVQLSENSESIIVNDGSTSTEYAMDISTTLQDVVDNLNLIPNFSAEITNVTGLEQLPGRAITEIFQVTNEISNEYDFEIKMPVSPLQLLKQTNNGLWKSQFTMRCGMIHSVLYYGGYQFTEDLPTGLQQLVAQIVAGIYRTTSRDITLESEKVGDYAYKNNSGIIQSFINTYTSQLLLYKNVSV